MRAGPRKQNDEHYPKSNHISSARHKNNHRREMQSLRKSSRGLKDFFSLRELCANNLSAVKDAFANHHLRSCLRGAKLRQGRKNIAHGASRGVMPRQHGRAPKWRKNSAAPNGAQSNNHARDTGLTPWAISLPPLTGLLKQILSAQNTSDPETNISEDELGT